MSKTQIDSLKNVQKKSAAGLREEVLDLVQREPGLSRRQIASRLNHEEFLSSITARCHELLTKGHIVEKGSVLDETSGQRVACLYPSDGNLNSHDIKLSNDVRKIFKLLKKIQKDNVEFTKRLMEQLNTHFNK